MKIIGLLVSALVALAIVYFTLLSGKDTASAPGTSPSASLGAPPPVDMSRNAKGTIDYTKRQGCLANCGAEDRTCAAMAFEPMAQADCATKKIACEASCP